MANEKNANVVTESNVQTMAKQTAQQNLLLERTKFIGKDNKEYWSYAVYGKVRGRDTKVDFNAADQGGYEVLDMVFDIKPTAELIIHDETMTTEDGEVRKYTVYDVQNVDEDGDIISCQVKPARKSDKSILEYLLKKLRRQSGGDVEA